MPTQGLPVMSRICPRMTPTFCAAARGAARASDGPSNGASAQALSNQFLENSSYSILLLHRNFLHGDFRAGRADTIITTFASGFKAQGCDSQGPVRDWVGQSGLSEGAQS